MSDQSSEPEIFAALRAANSLHGEAVAFIYIAGHALKLAFDRIEWLLEDERWRHCGFGTIEAFADSRHSNFRNNLAPRETRLWALLTFSPETELPC